MEMVEVTITEKMAVLCLDDLNLKFDLKVSALLKNSDGKTMMAVLNRQGSKMKWQGDRGVLAFDNLYETYVSGPARSITRGQVSKYETTDIRGNRKAIEKAIKDELLTVVDKTPVEITMVVTSNLDYPDVITDAMEAKRKREIGIEQEKAQQAIELLKVDNRLKIAQKMKITRAAEAEAEGAYNTVMARSLSDHYLKLRDIEAKLTLRAQRAEPVHARLVELGGKRVATGKDFDPATGRLSGKSDAKLVDQASARSAAESLRQLVIEGRDFGDVARERSDDELTREAGGTLGWFTPEELSPEIRAVLVGLEPGEIGDVVRGDTGYYVIKLVTHEPGRMS